MESPQHHNTFSSLQVDDVNDKRRLPQVGDLVDVWWDDRHAIYRGTLDASPDPISPTTSRKSNRRFRYTVCYDDGDIFVHDFNAMTWRFVHAHSKHVGKWIEPGELQLRVVRYFKSREKRLNENHSTVLHHSKHRHSPIPLFKKSASPSQRTFSPNLVQATSQPSFDSAHPTKHFRRSDTTSRNETFDSRPDTDAVMEENTHCSSRDSVRRDDEQYVLEALLLLSQNYRCHYLPSSPMPYRKRHNVRYISSVPTQ